MIHWLKTSLGRGLRRRFERVNSRDQPTSEVYCKAALYWTPPAGTMQRLTIEVPERIPEAFVLPLPMPLPERQRVWISVGGRRPVPSVVRQCLEQDGSFRVRFLRVQTDRRRAKREQTSGTGRLRWRAEDGTREEATVKVCDVGEEGLAIETPKQVPINQVVLLSGQDFGCVGFVCACTRLGSRYRAGIQFAQKPYSLAPD